MRDVRQPATVRPVAVPVLASPRMDACALLRPTSCLRRVAAALVVVALLGWLGVAPSHLHVPTAVAVAHATDGDTPEPAGSPDATHPCQFCLSIERGAAPPAAPAIVVALAPHAYELLPPDPPVADVAVPAVYRSRAPPHA